MSKNWANKVHKQMEVKSFMNKLRQTEEYKEDMRKVYEQAVLNAMMRISCLTCEHLEMKHGYKKNGLTTYLTFIKDRMEEIGKEEDENYFQDAEKYFKEEYGLDILKVFGLALGKDVF